MTSPKSFVDSYLGYELFDSFTKSERSVNIFCLPFSRQSNNNYDKPLDFIHSLLLQ